MTTKAKAAKAASARKKATAPRGLPLVLDLTPAPDDLLRRCADTFRDDQAQAADRDDAARRMLADFCVRQWHGKPQSPVTLDWLADVASAELDHDDNAYRGFGLAPRPAHRRKGSGQDWLPRVAAVELLQRADSKAHALAVVAQAIGVTDTRRLEKAVAEHQLSRCDADLLCAMADGVLPACVRVIEQHRKAYPKLAERLLPAPK